MKKLLTIAMLLTLLNGDKLIVKQGWNLVGIGDEELNVSKMFRDTNISVVYSFDHDSNSWKAYSSNSTIMKSLEDKGYGKLETINSYSGVWVYSNYASPLSITSDYGVILDSPYNDAKIVFAKDYDASLDGLSIAPYMYLEDSNGNYIGKIQYSSKYYGKVFYISIEDKLYQGTFETNYDDYSSSSSAYRLTLIE